MDFFPFFRRPYYYYTQDRYMNSPYRTNNQQMYDRQRRMQQENQNGRQERTNTGLESEKSFRFQDQERKYEKANLLNGEKVKNTRNIRRRASL